MLLSRQVAGAAGGGFDVTERAGKRSDGRKQGWNSADGCGADRVSLQPSGETPHSLAQGGGIIIYIMNIHHIEYILNVKISVRCKLASLHFC